MTSDIVCNVILKHSDMVMQNHRVHGVSVMPGVVFLELTVRILETRGFHPEDYELRRIRFLEPVVTSDSRDAALRITIEMPWAGTGSVTVSSRDAKSDDPFQPNMRATLVREASPRPTPLPAAARHSFAENGLDMTELYRRARAEHIEHGARMRCDGMLRVSDGALVGTLGLEVKDDSPFLMHPAALDATTIAAFGQTPSAFDDPFIPVTIDRFRYSRRLPGRFVMVAPQKEVLSDTADLISNSYDLFDTDGNHCAIFERLACKRIRSPDLIQRLLTGRRPADEPAPWRNVAASNYRDQLRSWIADMLGIARELVATDQGYYDLGLDSGQLLAISERLEQELGLPVYPTLLFEHSHIDALATYLEQHHGPLPHQAAPRIVSAEPAGSETVFARIAWLADARPCDPQRSAGVLNVAGLSQAEQGSLRARLGIGWQVDGAPGHRSDQGTLRAAHLLALPAGKDEDARALLVWAVEAVKRIAGQCDAADIVFLSRAAKITPGLAGLAAYCRSVRMETPRLAARVLHVDGADWASALALELQKTAGDLPVTAGLVRQAGEETWVEGLAADTAMASVTRIDVSGLFHGGTCVISGGGGGIARHLCEWLLRAAPVQVVLLGRGSAPPPWLVAGAVRYRCCDVTDHQAVGRVLEEERQVSGPIRAVFHLAGAHRDAVHLDIDRQDVDETLAAKLDGFHALDRATSADPLAVFVVFSSLAAWRPNPGQATYAFANAALEQLAAERNANAARPGRTLSLAWPLWQDGGMRLTEAQRIRATSQTGLNTLSTAVALAALAAAVASPLGRLAVLHGDPLAFNAWLAQTRVVPAVPVQDAPDNVMDIAIVGLAGRFPDAQDIEAFWDRLCHGQDAIREVPAERWDHARIFDCERHAAGKTYSRWGGFLDGIDIFDADMFNVSRKEAERMDPQERLFLENCWTLLENAGHPARTLKGCAVGVYAGVMWNHYQLHGTQADIAPAALHAAIANRVSYTFDLTGPSMAVDTACSSSLTALGLAVDALRLGYCSMAIAGGVNLSVHEEKYRQLALGQFLSDDGRCRSFGAGGNGYVPGEGVGAVLLRPLRDALKDGDHVWAVVRGCALRHGGRTGGVTVPSPAAQAAVIEQAWKAGGISAESICYVEAHGTGTALGDPIEIQGLVQALGEARSLPLPIGSVKSNIGHLESAAGIAAIAKVLLMMQQRQLVPSLHADPPNPNLAMEGTGLHVVRSSSPWRTERNGGRLRAVISSFGAGGANAHLALDEPPAARGGTVPPGPHLILLSARDQDGLRDYAARMAQAIKALAPTTASSDVASWLAGTLGVPAEAIDGDDTLAALGVAQADILALQRLTGADIGLDCRVRDLPGMATAPSPGLEDGALLGAIAHHLQLHRTHLSERLAFVAGSLGEVVASLEAFAHRGRPLSCDGPANLREIGGQWLAGAAPDVAALWHGPPPTRLSLPVPKLNRQHRFWLGRWKAQAVPSRDAPPRPGPATKPAASQHLPVAQQQEEIRQMAVQDAEIVSLKILDDRVAVVTMNDPDHHNMFTAELLSGLERAFAAIQASETIGAVVLTGTARVFSLGGTPDTLERLARKELSFTSAPFIYEGLGACRVPVVAAIAGYASGGGLTFGLHADLIVMDRSGTYSANFVKFGFTPGLGATYVLERCFGRALANEMCLTGKDYSGQELESQGVAVRFADHGVVVDTALRLARAIADNPRNVVGALKRDQAERTGAVLAGAIRREADMHAAILDDSLVPQIRTRSRAAPSPAPDPQPSRDIGTPAVPASRIEEVRTDVQAAVGRTLYMDIREIEPARTFADMGLDSLGAVEIVRDLNVTFGTSFDSVLIYDFPTVNALADRIVAEVDQNGSRPAVLPGAVSTGGREAGAEVAVSQPPSPPPPADRPVVRPAARRDVPPLSLRAPAAKDEEPAQRAAPVLLTRTGGRSSTPGTTSDAGVPVRARHGGNGDIAIVGMSARYPGSRTVDEFWQILSTEGNTVGRDTGHRWNNPELFARGLSASAGEDAEWVGFVDAIDQFDPGFFGISPREAELMDPQQRVFLEQSWRALEHAGYTVGPDRPVDCGIFVGTSSGDYLSLLRDRGVADSGQVFLGNSGSVLAGRLAYFMNLKGPTVALDTACSSSLVAVHLACQSIRSGDCGMAIAGGIGLMVTPQMYLWNSRSGMLSPRGRCASFDASADGFVLGEGAGVVVLKPLADAIRDRDCIHAVIKASGINGDGKTNGITAPCAESQLALQRRVHERSGIAIDDIAYIETHGAGTQLGDPIEIKALNELVRDRTATRPPCGVGSVKSNIGHTTLAAGVAGLMKVTLALKHRTIPASLHFESLNDKIQLDPKRLRVVARAEPWPAGANGARAAAVNSFGVSGTNCHVVVCEAPEMPDPAGVVVDDGVILPLSAKTRSALEKNLRSLRADLASGICLEDAAFTLGVGRAVFKHRTAVVARSRDEVLLLMDQALASGGVTGVMAAAGISAAPRVSDGCEPMRVDELVALASRFCDDGAVDFDSFYAPRKGRRTPLTGYALDRRRFWVPDRDDRVAAATSSTMPIAVPAPRRLLEIVDAQTSWAMDHDVLGRRRLPGAAILHWGLGQPAANRLWDVEWSKAAEVTARHELYCILSEDGLGFTVDGAAAWAHAKAGMTDVPRPARLNYRDELAHLRNHVPGEELYRRFEDAGIKYGPSYRLLRGVHHDGGVAIARLEPQTRPSIQLYDAILQSAAALGEEAAIQLPRRIGQVIRRARPVESTAIVRVRAVAPRRFDFTACDLEGNVTLEIEGFELAPLERDVTDWPRRAVGAAVAVPESGVAREAAPGQDEAGGYIPRWSRYRATPSAVAPEFALLSWGQDPASLQPQLGQVSNLVLDVRQAPDHQPDEVLQTARGVFQRLATATHGALTVTVVTSGAAALEDHEPLRPLQTALTAFARAAVAECPSWRFVAVDAGVETHRDARGDAIPPFHQAREGVNLYRGGEWYQLTFVPTARHVGATAPFQDGHTYLIVGGAGGLGYALSQDLARRHRVRIGWIGRRQADDAIHRQIVELERLGAQVRYACADVADLASLQGAIRDIRSSLGPISGVYHSALVLEDVSVARMSERQLSSVLRPKIDGIRALHAAVEGEPIDQFVVFSSVASVMQAAGQGNYAAASAYVDAFAAEMRRRHGTPTYIVNWGYWGGVGAVRHARYAEAMAAIGVGSISPEDGHAWLRHQLSSKVPQLMVLKADPRRFAEFGLTLAGSAATLQPSPDRGGGVATAAEPTGHPGPARSVDVTQVEALVATVFARILKMSPGDLDVTATFEAYGVDSLIAMDIVRDLRKTFDTIPATLLYEHLTIAEVAAYLLAQRRSDVERLLPGTTETAAAPPVRPATVESGLSHHLSAAVVPPPAEDAIAIIGLAGRYPGADTLEEFWENLRMGRRSIAEAPSDRGNWRQFLDKGSARNRTGNIHGGFIKDVDLFDARFFNILPSDAARLDPQERLFLELCWELLEGAGRNGDTSREPETGVFIGSMYGSYGQIAAAQGWGHGRFDLGHSPMWSIANRISYHFDLTGPSLCVDTACSSSLAAFHLACESLHRRECRQAIAGGVNLVLHPAHHIALASMRMLGTGAACRTFDKSADGIVPGEGVGAVLLRPLADALADGDQILAVACGSMMNAGGKTGGYTVPNPAAQADVVRRAIARSGLSPDSIDCIEVHGTGTELGDPIEIAALRQVFDGVGRPEPVRVSSVKANIGHLEGAAGIAGLTKAVLQLRHRAFAPCAGLDVLNDKIDFGSSVQPVTVLDRWTVPTGDPSRPRACGVSSFGAGGANAHVLLQEFPEPRGVAGMASDGPPLFLLSATDDDQLRRYADRMARWLRRGEAPSLAQLCFTSQTGRRALQRRAALVVKSLDELAAALDEMAAGTASAQCRMSPSSAAAGALSGSIVRELAETFTARSQWLDLGELWTAGVAMDWERLWPVPPGRCAYPTLPLNRSRYWLPDPGPEGGNDRPEPASTADGESWLAELSAHHHIKGQCLVPGAALLEVAAGYAGRQGSHTIRDFRWLRPLLADDGRGSPRIALQEHGGRCGLYDAGAEHRLAVFEVAQAEPGEAAARSKPQSHDRLPHGLDGAEFYANLRDGGFVYGASLQSVRRIEWGDGRCVAWLKPIRGNAPGVLATVLDGAMQTVALLSRHKAALPAGVTLFRQVQPAGRAAMVVTEAGAAPDTYDIRVVDMAGDPVLVLSGFHVAAVAEQGAGLTYLQVVEADAPAGESGPPLHAVLLAAEDEAVRRGIADELAANGIHACDDPGDDVRLDGAILCVAESGGPVAERLTAHVHRLCRMVDLIRQHRNAATVRVVVATVASDMVARSLAGAIRSLNKENPWLAMVHVVVERWDLAALLVRECREADAATAEIGLTRSGRTMRVLQPFEPAAGGEVPVRSGGLYVIAGGGGGLGRIFAAHLASLAPVTVALLGRRVPSADLAAWIAGSAVNGSRLVYRQADICDDAGLSRVFRDLVSEFGPIRGIVQAAGVNRDGLAKTKEPGGIAAVLAPKVAGTLALDRCSAAEDLDFFLLCSSLAAETGNAGQADYAAANRFLVDFVQAREQRRRSGLCAGNTTAVAWPLWRDGGMSVDDATERRFATHYGMRPLSTRDGLAAFDRALTGHLPYFALVDGVHGKRTTEARHSVSAGPASEPAGRGDEMISRASGPRGDALRTFVAATLRTVASSYLLVEPQHVELDRPLIEMGFDSISLTDLVGSLNGTLGLDLLPSILFECPTLTDVAAYLVAEHDREISDAAAKAGEGGDIGSSSPESLAVSSPTVPILAVQPVDLQGGTVPAAAAPEAESIAIIGMAGRFAGADSLPEFWRMLVEGEDFLRNVDDSRPYLRDDPATAGLRAGFLKGCDLFDAGAFGISPREAERMDPQQRLFIEAAWEALQDAGHAPARLRGREIGVFAGVSTSDYGSLMVEAGMSADPHVATGVSHSILANRVSHIFDWTGPSEVIDTACSSSLVALHHAVAAIRRDECEMACVGGVNLTLSPTLFKAFDQSGMLSKGHRCKTFAADADGYVRGEGVGVVILRRLSAAIRDNDHVYAILRGSAVNHTGRSTSLTAPNPSAQAKVIRKAIAAAGVEPRSIGFIETHGTGTRLGDLVEVEGLKQAFGDGATQGDATGKPWIWLGAVKTAIGHLEAAAGIAGVIRTVLSLWHNHLCANRNMGQVNPHLRLDGSPFMVLDHSRPWVPQAGEVRRAGVSSFGFGGTNAHVILESYPPFPSQSDDESGPVLVPLSAPTTILLQRYAVHLDQRIEQDQPALADVALTLQQGRDPLAARAVFVVASLAELREGLRALGSSPGGDRLVWAPDRSGAAIPAPYRAAAQSWLAGEDVVWPFLQASRCSLPPVPLDRKRYWFRAPPPFADRPAAPLPPPGYGGDKIRLVPISAPSPSLFTGSSMATETTAEPSTSVCGPLSHAGQRCTEEFERRLSEALSAVLQLEPDHIGLDQPFGELGLDSILRMDFSRTVNDLYGLSLGGADLYEVDTLRKLSALVQSTVGTVAEPTGVVVVDGPAVLATSVDEEGLASVLCDRVRELTGHRVGRHEEFVHAGLTSFDMLKVIADLERMFGALAKTLLFDHPSPHGLGEWLRQTFDPGLICGLAGMSHPQATSPGLPDHAVLEDGAVVIRKNRLQDHPDVGARVRRMERQWAKEQGLPGRDIAPFLYVAAGDIGYLHFTARDGLLLAWNSCASEENFVRLVAAWTGWARRSGFKPNLLSLMRLDEVDGGPFCSTPFGAVQRIEDLAAFSLEGRKMARLRNKVVAFSRSGTIDISPYVVGADPETDGRIVQLVDQWAGRKDMVNPYVHRVRREIGDGILADDHRVFLTRVDDTVVAAIVITRMPSEKGYLLDLEFSSDEMPNGGLDYSIVRIIEQLRDEGGTTFSFGATLGVHVCDSPNAHPETERTLADLQKTGIFKGHGNLQFKSKFRPETLPIYLCQPADTSAADISALLLMIAEPLVEAGERTCMEAPRTAGQELSGDEERWRHELRKHGWNPLAIPPSAHNFNLCTDSWTERNDPFIVEHARATSADGASLLEGRIAPDFLPFDHFHPTHSGKAAEALLLGWLPAARRTIVHNNVFPSWTYHCLDLGCTPIPVESRAATGEISVAHLEMLFAERASDIGLCCFELAPNALGGPALNLENLREVCALARSRSVPVVFDATRGLSNAWRLSQDLGRPFKKVVRELYSLATAVTMSLSKEYGLRSGGLIATSDPSLTSFLQGRSRDRGHDVGLAERQAIAAALLDTDWVTAMVAERAERVSELGRCLTDLGVPLAAVGLHAVLVDARTLCPGQASPAASVLAWLYRHSGIIAAPHLNSGLAATRNCVRLTLPVAMPEPSFRALLASLRTGLAASEAAPDLLKVSSADHGLAHYVPRGDVPDDIAEDLAAERAPVPAEANGTVLRAWQPDVQCRLLPYGQGVVEVFEAGAGPAIVFLHPFNIGAGFFAPQFRGLAASHRVIVLHAPGAGRTTATDDMTFDGLCDLILSCAEVLDLQQPFTLVGASFGGLTALSFACRYPKHLNALVLLGSSYKVGNRKGEVNRLAAVVDEDFKAMEAAGRHGELPSAELRSILRQCETMDARIGLRYLDVFALRPNLLDRVGTLRLPTLHIHGLHDTVINIRIAETLVAAIPRARLVTLDNAGHFPSLTCPDEVNRQIRTFLDGVVGDEAEAGPMAVGA